jgi:hypothetical protein
MIPGRLDHRSSAGGSAASTLALTVMVRPFTPHLAAALADAEPARSEDDIFTACIMRLIDAARPNDRR